MITVVSLVLGTAAITLSLAVMFWPSRQPPLPRDHTGAPVVPSPLPAPADNTQMIAEVLSKAITETAEAIGKAVQTAQHAPEPPERKTVPMWVPDADIQAGLVDDSDPTDGQAWLQEPREDVAFLEDGESPIPGVEMRP